MKTQWVWMFLWSNAMDFWNNAYEANNGFKKQCNWFRGMLIDNTFDLKLCLWSNAINLEQFLWNAMNLEICLDVDSIVELCLWINTIDFELCLQSNTMDLQQHNGFAAAQWIWNSAYEAAHLIWSCAYEARQWTWSYAYEPIQIIWSYAFDAIQWIWALLMSNIIDMELYNGFELCLWAT